MVAVDVFDRAVTELNEVDGVQSPQRPQQCAVFDNNDGTLELLKHMHSLRGDPCIIDQDTGNQAASHHGRQLQAGRYPRYPGNRRYGIRVLLDLQITDVY
jgi:hypothetical protein